MQRDMASKHLLYMHAHSDSICLIMVLQICHNQ